ncbi:Protein regulator of cytokinesis 1 [Orchesella cincta]|uniref:Protein regulator of cytokinesis 1 n=1 Tax=Orchesella cincta TaxID=48709 RepID=A0A1D2MYY2_ORCCI|nr:Protein regulator of cytokinesis 1 [Orchesella cincta]
MDTPHKDNECEKQLMASVESEEFYKRNLKSEFAAWRRKIKPLYEVLGTKPEGSAAMIGKLIMAREEELDISLENLTNGLIAECQDLYDQLTQRVQSKKTEAKALWNELSELWNELDQNEEFGLGFTNAEIGILSSLHDLKSQYLSRKVDKSRRLCEFIKELRKEISDIWDQCMITEEEKKQFVEFESCEFTENMLHIHKEELGRWKIYHQKNQELLLKIQKRETMWTKLRELEAKASDPSRFNNRGGSLLKDQNMHNYLMKNLPKLETELTNLAQKFEEEHGKKMKILGEEIPSMIEKDWKAFKEGKSGRKAPTPTKPILNNIRRSIAPTSVTNIQPQIRPLEKRFGSKIELGGNAPKRPKLQPLKAIQDDG